MTSHQSWHPQLHGIGFAFLLGCSSTSSTSPTGPPDAATDAGSGVPDVMTPSMHDAPPPLDASEPGPVCAPGDVSGYMVTWHPPRATPGSCTDTELDGFMTACIEPGATNSKCTAYQSASPRCFACAKANGFGNASWGPVLYDLTSNLFFGNFSGCIDLVTGDTSATSCGAKSQADFLCGYYACQPSCPTKAQVDAGGAIDAFNSCLDDAESANSVCATYDNAASNCLNALDGGTMGAAYMTCAKPPGSGFFSWIRTLEEVFCGGASVDGGGG